MVRWRPATGFSRQNVKHGRPAPLRIHYAASRHGPDPRFEVPGDMVLAEVIVRNIVPGEGMGVEFTKMNPQTRALLERLLTRLLR